MSDTTTQRLAEIRASVAGDAAAPPGYDISPSDLAERGDLLALVDAAQAERDLFHDAIVERDSIIQTSLEVWLSTADVSAREREQHRRMAALLNELTLMRGLPEVFRYLEEIQRTVATMELQGRFALPLKPSNFMRWLGINCVQLLAEYDASNNVSWVVGGTHPETQEPIGPFEIAVTKIDKQSPAEQRDEARRELTERDAALERAQALAAEWRAEGAAGQMWSKDAARDLEDALAGKTYGEPAVVLATEAVDD